MKNSTSTRLYAYWNEIRGSRLAPHRFEVEPVRIADILAQTFILERDNEDRFRFRLAGTRVCEQFGREFRGQNILNMWGREDRIKFDRVLRSISGEGAAGVISLEARAHGGQTVPFEILMLPLVHTGNSIDRILGSMSVEDIPPFWLGSIPLVSQKISCIRLIWPDGRPNAVLQNCRRQVPLSPLPNHKRVDSDDRRRFRVFEGGRNNFSSDEKQTPGPNDS